MLKQLNDTINYIEEHLLDEKVIDEAMKRVSVSELHFKNVFFFLTGMWALTSNFKKIVLMR